MCYRYGISNINLLFLYGCWIRTSALMRNVSSPYERTLYDICVGSRTLSGAFAKRFSCLLVLCCARLPAPHSLMPHAIVLLPLALNWSQKSPPSSGSHTEDCQAVFFLCWHCCGGNPKACACQASALPLSYKYTFNKVLFINIFLGCFL